MAEAVVSFVVERVGDLIIQQGRSLAGVGDQVRRAHTDLRIIKAFLKDADAKRRDNETIRIFVAETRDAAYDLEDVIETFVLKVESKRKGGIKSVLIRLGCIFNEGVHLHQIGSEIGHIMSTISDLRTSLQTYDIREIRESGGSSSSMQLNERQQLLRRTYSHVVERNVVGLEGSAYELVIRLTKEEHRNHRVVSIWGMGGLGKTTLAKQVYHHEEVKRHFECFAWVSISQQYQVRDVLETIYVKLISPTKEERKEIARLKDAELPGRLSRLQNEKKCLIVLDDIWKTETWDFLKAAFECDEKTKSRILLTTRNEKVALHADVNGFRYQPPPLNETESWELFEKIAMCGRDDATDKVYMKMKELGKKMLTPCAGLPLAITLLAGLLAKKNTVSDWNTIYENVCVYISRGIGHQEEEHASASWVLALSYDDLPYHLKPCFLYLGHFPEDRDIHVKRLIKLWIAEGFISLTQQRQGLGETMEDVAYNWLSELVERCMVQVGERSLTYETFRSCRMHDLMRDLCLLKAEEENFLMVVNFSHKNEAMHPISSSNISNASPMGKIRRLAIYLDEKADQFVPPRDEAGGGHLRSLLYFGPNDNYWTAKRKELIIPSMFKDFKLLRVLKIEGVELQQEEDLELPSAIGNMVHLRFLSLRRSRIKSFPRFLGNLICLQTLDFRVQNDEIVIPNVIWKMNRLRHLYLPWDYRASGKLQLYTLGDLQTLNSVSSECCDLNDVAKLRNLRKLRIRLESRSWKNLEKILEDAGSVLNGIRSLWLWNKMESGAEEVMQQIVAMCGQIYKLTLVGPTLELPKEFHSYSNLTRLILYKCGLKDDQMAKLEKLPNLKILDLDDGSLGENTKLLVFSNGSFPRLQFLTLDSLEVTEWRVEEGAMPSLCQLLINNCRGLSRVPDGVRHVTTLKEVRIGGMRREFCSKVEVGGEDFHKIQHVPSLVIRNPIDD
ncbi:hypothetical protein M0R45_018450 [Rubus argutus]|uniref:Uncharacterized protein n=1 Tax=Rubus argutus TaxID=59490 RepID=A0AAW1X482_RUBAR